MQEIEEIKSILYHEGCNDVIACISEIKEFDKYVTSMGITSAKRELTLKREEFKIRPVFFNCYSD